MRSNYPKYDKYSKKDQKKKTDLYGRLTYFLKNSKRILKIAIGLVILGVLSYVIQLIFTVAAKGLFP